MFPQGRTANIRDLVPESAMCLSAAQCRQARDAAPNAGAFLSSLKETRMPSNCLMFGWNRAVPGRESASAQLFQAFVEYLTAQQRAGSIESFEVVLLEPRGSILNGFFLIRGDAGKLHSMTTSEDWMRQQTKAILNLQDISLARGATGALVGERMKMWMEEIPRG